MKREMPRVERAILSRFLAGDGIIPVAWDYGLIRTDVEAIIRRALKRKGKRVKS